MERHGSVGVGDKKAVGKQRMEMGIQIRDTAKPLYERDRPGLTVPDPQASAPKSLPGEEGPGEGMEHVAEEDGVRREEKAHGEGERENPLAVGGLWEHAIHQVGGDLGGASRPAGWTQPALARKRDETLELHSGQRRRAKPRASRPQSR